MAGLLGWSPERAREEVQRFETALWEEESLLERARAERDAVVARGAGGR
jgi:hypothetical protein